jgi:dTDP-4-amino-4,6-dideoxygalactose transaminase
VGFINFQIDFSPPDISELEVDYVCQTLKSGWITTGPRTKLLEKKIAEYCGTNRAVCLNSATSCMELCLRLFNIGPGDEVITSAYTYTASCSPIVHVGATPILVDTAKDSFEMDINAIEKAITNRTKAIIPIDIAGRLCDYGKIFSVVKEKKDKFSPNSKNQELLGRILVLADAAHSFGAKFLSNGVKSGAIADFSAFSFHAVKNLTTAEGGALTWRKIEGIEDDEIYKNLTIMSLHGQSKDALAKMRLSSWEYDIKFIGYKCNMTDVLASIGLAQLKRYSQILKKRREIIEYYCNDLKNENITFVEHFNSKNKSSGHLYCVRLTGRDESFRNLVIAKMAEKNIATNVHYKPLPMFTAYKNLGFDINDFPNAFNVYKNEITLPLYSALSLENADYIVKNFKKFI